MFSAFDSSAILEASQENTARTGISAVDQKQLSQSNNKFESDTTSATEHDSAVHPLNHYEFLLGQLNNVVTRDG